MPNTSLPTTHEPRRPQWATGDELLEDYYDNEWGLAVKDERQIFERLSLEVFQSGLTWRLVLQRRSALRLAFASFDPEKVAVYTATDVLDLLGDKSIIRNQRKIKATITNAQATLQLREHGGLSSAVWRHHQPIDCNERGTPPRHNAASHALAKQLKQYGFVGIGPVNTFALMCAIGVFNYRIC